MMRKKWCHLFSVLLTMISLLVYFPRESRAESAYNTNGTVMFQKKDSLFDGNKDKPGDDAGKATVNDYTGQPNKQTLLPQTSEKMQHSFYFIGLILVVITCSIWLFLPKLVEKRLYKEKKRDGFF